MKKQKLTQSKSKFFTDGQKEKRWKRGQSCATNPTFNRFRQQAKKNKSGVYTSDVKKSYLTVNALQKHEAINIDRDFLINDDASSKVSVNSAGSFMSVCTNLSFSKIINRFTMSNSAAHKEVLVIIEAVAELIKENNEIDTDTDYFAALLLLLKNDKFENDIQLNAIMYLLTISVKRVPSTVLKAKFSESSKIILDLLNDKINSDSQSLIRSAIIILAHLLRCQDYSSWALESTKHLYYSILCLVDSPRPKIRKAAHQAVGIVLRGSLFMSGSKAPSNHPAANQTAKYCIKKLEKQSNSTFFILGLLSDIMSVFICLDLKFTCESILRLMNLPDWVLKTVCIGTFRKMFGMRPMASVLPAELNAQIISALYEYRPSDEDSKMAEQWMLLMQKAYSNLSRLDAALFLSHLPRLYETCMKYLQTHSQLASTVSMIFRAILNDCNKEIIEKVSHLSQEKDSPIHKLFRKLEHSLGYQFFSVWDTVLIFYAHFIEIFGKICPTLFYLSLKLISTLRDTQGFLHVVLIDKVFGSAVKYVGPQHLLRALPLNITGNNDDLTLSRSWLLPVMRDNTQNTELSFYIEYFLPLALNIKRKCDILKDSPQNIEYKTYVVLQNQIWSLLPGFCTQPTDLIQSFPKIAQLLGKLVQTNNDVRLDILNSIRKLIYPNIEKELEKEVLARFAKNFIPIFCNLYTLTKSSPEVNNEGDDMMTTKSEFRSLPKSHCLAILETFKSYLKIADQSVVETCIQTCLKKLSGDEISAFQKYLLIDLVTGMLPYISLDHLKTIYTFAFSNLEAADKTLQKKLYRILEEICSSQSDAMKQLMTSSIDDIIVKLISTIVTSNPTSKGPRLKCLTNIMKHNKMINEKLISTILPEVVMCTKSIGERTRMAAYNLLIEMVKAYIMCHPNLTKNESLMKFVILLLPGLTISNMTMVACTILVITKVIFDLKECVDRELLKMLVESVCILLKSRSREVVQTALGFIKGLIVSFSNVFDQFLKPVVSSLVCMKEENHHHFRFKTKEIYMRLIRKYGASTILELIPSDQHRWINRMRKEIEASKRKKKDLKKSKAVFKEYNIHGFEGQKNVHKNADNEISDLLQDTDSEEDLDGSENTSLKSSKISKSRNRQSQKEKTIYLLEENDEPIDFLDPSASQKVLVSKPHKAENIKSTSEFKISSEGRIIIPNELDKDKKKPKKDAMIEKAVDLVDKISIKKRKRKISDDLNSNDDDEANKVSMMSYKSGGKGIHRPIQKKKLEPGQEFKAKKAHGDVKNGKLEPYAYFPLDLRSLNKRKRAKTAGQFRNKIKDAKKGALKGSKLKNKQHKKH